MMVVTDEDADLIPVLQNDQALVSRLRGELADQAATIQQQAIDLAHMRKIFDRASAAARLGVWECDLSDETLFWTDVVYDLFDLPRGSPIDRQQILRCYTPTARLELESRRARAIAEKTGFTYDAEMTTAKGRRRWLRITATIECEQGIPVRIFGMKQDITEEKILLDRTRYLAEFDCMTGLANRTQFQAKLAELELQHWRDSALLLIDLDGFKSINDTHGHAAGDACLQEAARRLATACGDAGFVARIGGDEFAILLHADPDQITAAKLASKIVDLLGRPFVSHGQWLRLGASVGLASASNCSAVSDMFAMADTALYQAKAAGRGTFRIFENALVSAE